MIHVKLLDGCPGTMKDIVLIEEARRQAGFRNGYGQFVAMGCPGADIDAIKAGLETSKKKTKAAAEGAKRTCKICGRPLPQGKMVYCSEECQDEGHRRIDLEKKKKYQRTMVPCAICGELVNGQKNRRAFCSDECRKEAYRLQYEEKKAARKTVMIPCKVCGKPFPLIGGKRYCSDECRKEMKRRVSAEDTIWKAAKQKTVETVPCKICGKMIPKLKANTSYCGPECRHQGIVLINRDARKRKKEQEHAGNQL